MSLEIFHKLSWCSKSKLIDSSFSVWMCGHIFMTMILKFCSNVKLALNKVQSFFFNQNVRDKVQSCQSKRWVINDHAREHELCAIIWLWYEFSVILNRIWSRGVSIGLFKALWNHLSCKCNIITATSINNRTFPWYRNTQCIKGLWMIYFPKFMNSHPILSPQLVYLFEIDIDMQGGVITERCYGCGRCFPVCPYDKIS